MPADPCSACCSGWQKASAASTAGRPPIPGPARRWFSWP